MKNSILVTLLLLFGACASPSQAPESGPAPQLSAAPETAPSEAPPSEAPPSREGRAQNVPTAEATDAPLSPPSENRDLHGPRDTQRYINMLAGAERVKQLKPELVAEKLVQRLDLQPDSVIADVGCGPGVFDWAFAAAVPKGFVFAVDVEPAQLDALRAGLLERDIQNVVPVLASYETPHLPPDSCDAIFVADTYHHIEDRVAYFSRLRKSLTANGALVILEFKDGKLPIGPPPSHKVPLATRHAELTAAGYTLIESLGTHIWQDLEIWRRTRINR